MDASSLSGSLKAAILIHSMGEAAAPILSGLNPRERNLIESHLTEIESLSPEVIEKVAEEFIRVVSGAQGRRGGNGRGVSAASGSGGARGDNSGPNDEGSPKSASLEALKVLPVDQLLPLIKDEHPQTIALVLVHLKTEVASEVLSQLDDDTKVDVALRIAQLDKVLSSMVIEIDTIFKEVLSNKKDSATHQSGGIPHLAEILNLTNDAASELILSEIGENNPEMAEMIKSRMFVFDDLVLVDDRGLQKVLRQVESAELGLALKGGSNEVREKIFKNMSDRAGEMLREEIDAIGAVRLADVEAAQQTVTRIIQDLESKGDIVIQGRGRGDLIA